MKKTLVALICTVLLATGGSALAYTLSDGTDVGGLDTYLAKTNLGNSGEAEELAWANSILSSSAATFEVKFDGLSSVSWQTAAGSSSIYAFYLGSNNAASYDYFLVKLGNNNGTGYTDYLFKNVNELAWAVLDITSSFDSAGITGGIEKISHISLFDSSSTPVPEPSTLLMLGAGLLGLGLYGRRRVQK